MHTLELYTHSDVDLPLSVVTVATASEEEARFGHAYIRVSEHMDLFNIENGTNPRALNSDSKKVKAIRQTLEEECGFAIYNGGVCIVIDDNSFDYDQEACTISFTCEQDGSGHYDGQHTVEGVRQGAPKAQNQQVSLQFVENRFFDSVDQIRKAAETWNSRDVQKLNSEQNQRGLFDILKTYLTDSHKSNIGWRENERNTGGELIDKECRIDRVVSLIYTAVPTLRSDYLDTGDEMHSILRKGYRSTMILEDANKAQDFERLFSHVDLILDLNDYIQKNLRTAFERNAKEGELFDSLQVVRKSGKADMKKPIEKRKFFSQQLFDGTRAGTALLSDYMQPVMYGFLKNILKVDRKTEKVIIRDGLNMSELKAIWDEAGYAVLSMLDDRFKRYFNARFNSRHAEFGCWSNLWDRSADVFEDVIDSGTWKR